MDQRSVSWQNRTHFFAIAARLMRRIVLERARARRAAKRASPVPSMCPQTVPASPRRSRQVGACSSNPSGPFKGIVLTIGRFTLVFAQDPTQRIQELAGRGQLLDGCALIS
ncbi:ECF-type sigma factor [Luteitalea pratensis]|uniref:ECF-type sigma factor n=1 Tax=Luteitalea pratensis TaxID=1855912 RepID=UPI003AB06B65